VLMASTLSSRAGRDQHAYRCVGVRKTPVLIGLVTLLRMR